MQYFTSRLVAVALAFLFVVAPLAPLRTNAQVRRVYDNGALGLVQLLRRLQTTASAMHTGAHPDDEDTALITRLARGDAARVAYLALNRGEGGQNVIGAELFEPLGVIRTEELLQSRALDGGQQMFTRVMDYGFSKTIGEAAVKWGEERTLGDMVRAIRTFRPLVIFSRFSGTPADGHGQHQFAGYLTPLAFKAAADPTRFPEQIRAGLRPWQVRKLYVGQGFRDTSAPPLRVETGVYDPLLGRTYAEIAAEGRSQHKSQEMGSLELRGPASSGLRLLARADGITGDDKSFFEGVDISLKGIGKLSGLPDGLIDNDLATLQDAAERALRDYNPLMPARSLPALAQGLSAVRAARAKLPATTAGQDADFLLAQKENEFSLALQRAAGVVVDALAGAETVTPGETTEVAVRVFVPAGADVKLGAPTLSTPQGWTAEVAPAPTPDANASPFRPRREEAQQATFFKVKVPADAMPTTPYWFGQPWPYTPELEPNTDPNYAPPPSAPRYVFRWADDAPENNQPFAAPLMTAQTKMTIGGAEISLAQGVEYRLRDDIRGELRRDVNVVPPLSVALDTNLIIAPVAPKPQPHRVAVRVTNYLNRAAKAQVRLSLPKGWQVAPEVGTVEFAKKEDSAAVVFNVTVPAKTKPGRYALAAQAYGADTGTQSYEMKTIAYPHIRTHRYYVPSVAQVRVLDVKTAPGTVGYIMGSGDAVPQAIERLGLSVDMLRAEDLASGDLSKYQTIVVGIRASQVRPDFVANNARLLDYARNGGTLIVQYQQPEYIALKLTPFPASMTTAAGATVRVVEEDAKVTILRPEHPVFNFPNKINEDDWAGWVQERNLYNFSTFDAQYTPLLEAHDTGEPESKGGMVYAKLGKGQYVYASYAFFRQLPAGVPGAYRLWANLLSLGAVKTK